MTRLLYLSIFLFSCVLIADPADPSKTPFDEAKAARTVKILTRRLNTKIPHEILAQIALQVIDDSSYFTAEERLWILLQNCG